MDEQGGIGMEMNTGGGANFRKRDQEELMEAVIPVIIDGLLADVCTRDQEGQYCGTRLAHLVDELMSMPDLMLGGMPDFKRMCPAIERIGCCTGTTLQKIEDVLAAIPEKFMKKMQAMGEDPHKPLEIVVALLKGSCEAVKWEVCPVYYATPAPTAAIIGSVDEGLTVDATVWIVAASLAGAACIGVLAYVAIRAGRPDTVAPRQTRVLNPSLLGRDSRHVDDKWPQEP